MVETWSKWVFTVLWNLGIYIERQVYLRKTHIQRLEGKSVPLGWLRWTLIKQQQPCELDEMSNNIGALFSKSLCYSSVKNLLLWKHEMFSLDTLINFFPDITAKCLLPFPLASDPWNHSRVFSPWIWASLPLGALAFPLCRKCCVFKTIVLPVWTSYSLQRKFIIDPGVRINIVIASYWHGKVVTEEPSEDNF